VAREVTDCWRCERLFDDDSLLQAEVLFHAKVALMSGTASTIDEVEKKVVRLVIDKYQEVHDREH
jgi:hypothetical protein